MCIYGPALCCGGHHIYITNNFNFSDELGGRKVKCVRRKIGQAKNSIKKTDRTNIVATNFV